MLHAGAPQEIRRSPHPYRGAPIVMRTSRVRPSSVSGMCRGSTGHRPVMPAPPRYFAVLGSRPECGSASSRPPLDGEARPPGWNARRHREFGAPPLQAEDALDGHAIHPAGRAGIPGPAASPRMLWMCVDVAVHHVGLGHVAHPAAARSRVWLMGLIMWNSSKASSPYPSSASAMMVHSAACVYWPPFSRMPGI